MDTTGYYIGPTVPETDTDASYRTEVCLYSQMSRTVWVDADGTENAGRWHGIMGKRPMTAKRLIAKGYKAV